MLAVKLWHGRTRPWPLSNSVSPMSAVGDRLFGEGLLGSTHPFFTTHQVPCGESLPNASGMFSVVELTEPTVIGPGRRGEKIQIYNLTTVFHFHPPLYERIVGETAPVYSTERTQRRVLLLPMGAEGSPLGPELLIWTMGKALPMEQLCLWKPEFPLAP